MISVKHLSKSFGEFTAVDDLSFSVAPGEVLGFLGPNGAGKSTTMKMITGFISPDAGSISVFDHDVQMQSQQTKQMIGYLPEGAPAWGEMTPAQFLNFIADIRALQGDRKLQRTNAVIEQLELQSVLHRPIDTLSKGFKRRVGIAQAIIHDPRVLILDEPTDGLDPNQKHQVRALIRNLATDKIVIISTHILEEVHAVCSRALIIANGKLVADNTPDELELQSRYHNAVTIELVESADIKNALVSLPGVGSVEQHTNNDARYTIFGKRGEEVFSVVNDHLQQGNYAVRSVHIERGRLDDVFRDITLRSSNTQEAA